MPRQTKGKLGAKLKVPGFDAERFLRLAGIPKKLVDYSPSTIIFAQGDSCNNVMYIQKGAVRLSVLSSAGKEAIVATLQAGDFLGEGALAGQSIRMATATAVAETSVIVVPKEEMIQLLHNNPGFSDRFIKYILSRNIRI
jgi:CRP-like cAMP-binding protein